jgi:hypothetical protein
MGLTTFLIDRFLGSAIEQKVQERLPAAVDSSLAEIGWRKLTGSSTRQLPMMTQDRAIEVAYWLWKTNPMARWIIEVVVAFVVAKGVPYTCENEEVKQILDDFWFDSINRMDQHYENFVRELRIYGEQCWPVFVAEQTGKVRLGYIDPAQIDLVIPDPENVKVKIAVLLKGSSAASGRTLRIVLDADAEDFLSPSAQAQRAACSGECFYFNINALTNEMRGTSDLFTVADHLDGYEQFLYDSSEKYARFNSFYWDVKVEGATAEELEKQRAAFTPPNNGGAFLHNEKVTSEPKAPNLNSLDSDKAARLHRNHILGAVGIPEHWFGGGGDVNRATAAEMDAPSIKMIEAGQEKNKNMLETVMDFVIAQALKARYLNVPEEEAYDYEVQTPEISQKDVAKLSAMLRDITTSLVAAQTQGWIDGPTAQKAFAYFMAFVGYEYDPVNVEVPEAGYEDYQNAQNGPVSSDPSKEQPSTGADNGSGS